PQILAGASRSHWAPPAWGSESPAEDKEPHPASGGARRAGQQLSTSGSSARGCGARRGGGSPGSMPTEGPSPSAAGLFNLKEFSTHPEPLGGMGTMEGTGMASGASAGLGAAAANTSNFSLGCRVGEMAKILLPALPSLVGLLQPPAPLLMPKRASSGPPAPTLPPNCALQSVPHHGPVSPPASALPWPHPMGPSVTALALAPQQPPPTHSPAPAPPRPLRRAGWALRLWLWVPCRDGALPSSPCPTPGTGSVG
ncbi:unnamed protein product, partial [Bubo scandiacus]